MTALAYDPLRDFAPIINAAYATSVIVVNSRLPVRTLEEFVAHARDRPGQLNYAFPARSGVRLATAADWRLRRSSDRKPAVLNVEPLSPSGVSAERDRVQLIGNCR